MDATFVEWSSRWPLSALAAWAAWQRRCSRGAASGGCSCMVSGYEGCTTFSAVGVAQIVELQAARASAGPPAGLRLRAAFTAVLRVQ